MPTTTSQSLVLYWVFTVLFPGFATTAVLTSTSTLTAGAGFNNSSDLTTTATTDIRCDILRWDALCPPKPSDPAACFSCCESHKTELVAMRCEGPLPNWNYSWHDHCVGLPPPPYGPPPPPPPPSPPGPPPPLPFGCTGPPDPKSQCATDYGGVNHPCPSQAKPLCTGFVPYHAWGHCCPGHVPGPPAPPAPGPYTLSKVGATKTFDGLGAISGGGATSRLLVDYPQPQREQILDYMFKPSFGAALQILKVEIGGDQDTTDGCESSHMHNNATVDLQAGYEWWLMEEAKKRNPAIKLYGLPWAFPGWVANNPQTGAPNVAGGGSPYDYPEQTCRYILEWVRGARTAHNLEIDYLGVWNEAPSDANYVKMLRKTLDGAGFNNTIIVGHDAGADICTDMLNDPEYANAVGVIGLHYPNDFYPASFYEPCHATGKPIWASEESSSHDDMNGAACWARVTNAHFVLNGFTASIMWNMLGSYYYGTAFYGTSLMTADQPWSGHYGDDDQGRSAFPVVWANAHTTQFTQIGWKYLAVGRGSGQLPRGGYFTTMVADSAPNQVGGDFTLLVVKISYDHAACIRPALPNFLANVSAEAVTFVLDASMRGSNNLTQLTCFKSNFQNGPDSPMFEEQPPVEVAPNGSFTLFVSPGDYFTVSTIKTAHKGSFATSTAAAAENDDDDRWYDNVPIPPSQPRFPLPLHDNFDSTAVSSQPRYWSNELGVFEVHPDHTNATNKVLRQMVDQPVLRKPGDSPSVGDRGLACTIAGMAEWEDIFISARFRLLASGASGCVATRMDRFLEAGLLLCVNTTGMWTLSYGNPKEADQAPIKGIIVRGTVSPLSVGSWHQLSLTSIKNTSFGTLDGVALFRRQPIRTIDTGFAALATVSLLPMEFDDVEVTEAGNDWGPAGPPPPPGCVPAAVGSTLHVRRCQGNGLAAPDQEFEPLPNWQLQHVGSKLCVTAKQLAPSSSFTLQECNQTQLQVFNLDEPVVGRGQQLDYTDLRNGLVPLPLGPLVGNEGEKLRLAASVYGNVSLRMPTATIGGGGEGGGRRGRREVEGARRTSNWDLWVFFPSTRQLRNQKGGYKLKPDLGEPMCLSLCK